MGLDAAAVDAATIPDGGPPGDGGPLADALPAAVGWTDQSAAVPRTTDWPSGEDLDGVAYGNGRFVAVGDLGTILTSPEGTTWSRHDIDRKTNLHCVTYGSSQFVACGAELGGKSFIVTSPDGEIWTRQALPEGVGSVDAVIWSGTSFIAVGYGGTVLTSPDGIAWTLRQPSSGAGAWLKTVAAGAGVIVAAGEDLVFRQPSPSLVLSDDDGAHFSTVDIEPYRAKWSALLYAGRERARIFLLGGGGSTYMMTSVDGRVWTTRPTPPEWVRGLAYARDTFVAVTDNRGIYIVSDPTAANAWRQVVLRNFSVDLRAVATDGARFVAVGQRLTIWTSP